MHYQIDRHMYSACASRSFTLHIDASCVTKLAWPLRDVLHDTDRKPQAHAHEHAAVHLDLWQILEHHSATVKNH